MRQELCLTNSLLNESEQIVRTRSEASRLQINVLEGTLFWSTSESVECSWMNGSHHKVIHLVDAPKRILSLTLDTSNSRLFWCEVSTHDSSLTIYHSNVLSHHNRTLSVEVIVRREIGPGEV